MTRVQRNRARLGLILCLAVIVYEILPFTPFVIVAVIVVLAAAAALAMHWHEQAVDVETENFQLRFAVAGLEADNIELAREQESLLDRLSAVLDEHSLCPAPVEDVAPKPPATGGIVQRGTVTIIGEGRKIPRQRRGES